MHSFSAKETQITTSPNVITENLLTTSSFESTFYITDDSQAFDLFWQRKSGIQVHIGVLDTQLIPKYRDVEHESDNEYIRMDRSNEYDKSSFERVWNNHCR